MRGLIAVAEQELQPNTLYNYTWLLGLVYPYIGKVRVSRLSARMAGSAYRDLEQADYSRSALRTLDLVLTKAFAAQTGRTLGVHKPRESDTVRPVWTLAEARRFLEHVQGDRLYPLWRLLLTTGLRRGELCGLMWQDLERDQGSLKVCRQRVIEDPTSQVREKPPKSHNGTRTLLLDNVTSRFNHLAADAGVRPIGPHQVRHLLVSSLLDDGYGIHEVAERLGHDPGTLMRYYTRVSAARRRQATLHIAELIAP
jgi:integrase